MFLVVGMIIPVFRAAPSQQLPVAVPVRKHIMQNGRNRHVGILLWITQHTAEPAEQRIFISIDQHVMCIRPVIVLEQH